jgi:hypothetical protein
LVVTKERDGLIVKQVNPVDVSPLREEVKDLIPLVVQQNHNVLLQKIERKAQQEYLGRARKKLERKSRVILWLKRKAKVKEQ